jgi:hypothetical protein
MNDAAWGSDWFGKVWIGSEARSDFDAEPQSGVGTEDAFAKAAQNFLPPSGGI